MATKRSPPSDTSAKPKKKARVKPVLSKLDKDKKWFFDIPPELRNTLYKLMLGADTTIRGSGYLKLYRSSSIKGDAPYNMPALLISSKKIRQEALAFYFETHTVSFSVPADELRSVSDWLRLTIRNCRKLGVESALRDLQVRVILITPLEKWQGVYDPAQITKICCTNKVSARIVTLNRTVRRGYASIIVGRILGYHAFKVGWGHKLFYKTIDFLAEPGHIDFETDAGSEISEWGARVTQVSKTAYDYQKFFPIDYRVIYEDPGDDPSAPITTRTKVIVKYQGQLLLLKDPFRFGPLEAEYVEVCDYAKCVDAGCWHHLLDDHAEWLADLRPSASQAPSGGDTTV